MAVIKNVSKIPDQLRKLGQADMAERVIALSDGVYSQMQENLNLKEELNALNDTLRKKDEDLKKLIDIAHLKKSLKFENDCYWDEKGHPICSACLEKPDSPAKIRMHTQGRKDGFVKCPVCKNTAYSKGDTSMKNYSIAYEKHTNIGPNW